MSDNIFKEMASSDSRQNRTFDVPDSAKPNSDLYEDTPAEIGVKKARDWLFMLVLLLMVIVAILAMSVVHLYFKQGRDIDRMSKYFDTTVDVIGGRPDNFTGLEPTADGMIMDNGAINYDALFSTLKADLTDDLPVPTETDPGLSERQVRTIASGVFKYYWKNAQDKAGDLPPWQVINY